ncbi:PREDICTED: uncharacterized protein LOC105449950 [Wasmannia auropunctata]|uniref:uncharacterized protein LOC105449950 n=1 Tax=Wasmannia auropunctata TaxID=64793 RepID=UPI0005EFE4B6|nr:PREDICTED: uncharacterized protein LOC105449950 [Wasmannia auropunctata]XP_011687738.1 PREDICTED: uncharacterized protein LOC105449950 [Wasmannia auropunctata]
MRLQRPISHASGRAWRGTNPSESVNEMSFGRAKIVSTNPVLPVWLSRMAGVRAYVYTRTGYVCAHQDIARGGLPLPDRGIPPKFPADDKLSRRKTVAIIHQNSSDLSSLLPK